MVALPNLYQLYRQSTGISIDSREVEEGNLFFGLHGNHFDGNAFAEHALRQGADYAIIDNSTFITGERTILVDGVLETLQHLATFHRQQLGLPILAVTGSNGKTTTKELITHVLQTTYACFGTRGNLNNHIGVPLSLLEITREHEIGVIEMGANHQGEIAQLCEIAQPNAGLITNIGKAHIKGFGSLEGVREAKGELYDYLRQKPGKVFVNTDHADLVKMSEGMQRITYGRGEHAQVRGEQIPSSSPYLKVKLHNPPETIQTQLVGDYNLENVLAATCVGRHWEVSVDQIKAAIESYQPKLNRSQVVHKDDNTFILDAYNANPVSMKAALQNFAQMDGHPKMVILGDMLELGEISEKEHLKIARLLSELSFDQVVLVGEEFEKVKNEVDCHHFPDVEALQQWFSEHSFKGYHILIKGSRGLKLEDLVNG